MRAGNVYEYDDRVVFLELKMSVNQVLFSPHISSCEVHKSVVVKVILQIWLYIGQE